MKRILGLIAVLVAGVVVFAQDNPNGAVTTENPVFAVNRLLARSVNFGNALEAPGEGAWGITLNENYFELVKKAGFTAIRLPANYNTHSDQKAPYKVQREFMLRIDWAIKNAKKRGLAIIIDLHNYEDFCTKPKQNLERWLGIWRQIATRYANQPDSVIFEPFNEPHDKLEPLWNDYFAKVLAVIRETNPIRAVVMDGNGWSNAERMTELQIPNDPNLILTFHNYTPFQFTHQGAEWWADSAKYLGTKWNGTPADQAVVTDYIEKAEKIATTANLPLYMGEFGAYRKADIASRIRWTTFTRQTAENKGISWGYWEFASGFGIYDPLMKEWRKDLLAAVIGK